MHKIRWGNVLTYLLFVVLAGTIWYGHAMRSVRNTRVPVLVSYTNVPGSLAFDEQGLPDTIMAEVRDAGQRLNGYLREPLRLTIDLGSYIRGEKGTIHLQSDDLRQRISNILQGTSRLIATTPEEVKCGYYTEQEKNVPLAIACQLEPAEEYQIVEQSFVNKKNIKIYGKDKVLESIDTLYTQQVNFDGLIDTSIVRVPLALPHGVRVNSDTVEILVIAERYTEKKIIVPIRIQGVPEGTKIRLFPQEVEATLRVRMSHFAQVTSQDVKAVCVYSSERKDKLDVELRYSNPYITDAWVYPGTVEFILEQ